MRDVCVRIAESFRLSCNQLPRRGAGCRSSAIYEELIAFAKTRQATDSVAGSRVAPGSMNAAAEARARLRGAGGALLGRIPRGAGGMTTSFDQFLDTSPRTARGSPGAHAAVPQHRRRVRRMSSPSPTAPSFVCRSWVDSSSGKSTVLNALVGADLLPTDAYCQCTSALDRGPARRRAGSPSHELVGASDPKRRSREDFLAGRWRRCHRIERRLSESLGGARTLPRCWPLAWCLSTPPAPTKTPRGSSMAMDELKRTDAALFVLSAQQLAGLDEINDLRELPGPRPDRRRADQPDGPHPRRPERRVLSSQATARLAPGGDRAHAGAAPSQHVTRCEGDARAVVASWMMVRRSLSETLLRNTAGARLGALQGSVEQLLRVVWSLESTPSSPRA
jgi:hypothetical protein